MTVSDDVTWTKWSMHVLEELKRLNTELKELNGKLDERQTDQAKEIASIKMVLNTITTQMDAEEKQTEKVAERTAARISIYFGFATIILTIITIIIMYISLYH